MVALLHDCKEEEERKGGRRGRRKLVKDDAIGSLLYRSAP